MITNRKALALYFKELGFKIGSEIGVLKGHYSMVLCRANPGVKLYCIDSWGIGERIRKDYHLRCYEKAKRNLAPYNTTLIHKTSMEAVKDFPDDSLDFVYIDANHRYEFVKKDISEWSKKVRKGGIISGHDYNTKEIQMAVNEHLNNNELHLTTSSDEIISWWFIKS